MAFHIRSNSFPSSSHPTTLRVEEALNKIKSSQLSSSESICIKLCRLAELYQCMDDLLNLPSTIQALSQQNNQRSGEGFLDGSLRILDICGITREIVSQLKENVRDLQSSLRRGKGDSSSMNNYTCFRKKMKKDAKKSMAALKQIDQGLINDDDQNISSVLREVTSTSTSVLQSVLIFLSSKPKSSKWSLVLRLVNKENEDQESQNELESVDSALKSGKIESIQKGLVTLEATIDGIENGLEGLFRCLIKSRTCLLNIFSC